MSTSMMLRRSFALLGLLLVTSVPAAAQRRNEADEGEYQILQARYGTAEKNVDVTQRLKELASQDRRFKLVNDLFNVDPAPGQRKTLRIYARGRDGQSRTFDYTEYSEVDGSQFTGWGSGNWGPDRNDNSWDEGRAGRNGDGRDAGEFQIQQARYGTAERNVDVTQRVRELVRADQRFVANNNTLGADPHPGKRKTLHIQARDRNGNSRDFDFAEDSTVEGAQFTARRRGN
ncbi:hypothetical protein BH11PSE10_BH11PSE10_02890 [soil metagenome]